ncbi:MAG: carboxypeptidase regulatory-like domain-containing protein [Gemmatimonadota bacterium]
MIKHGFRRIAGLASAGLAMLLFTTAGALHAQNSTGRVTGVVADSSGNPVDAGDIVALNLANGVSRTVSTRETGGYALAGMVPGDYDITARKIGMGAQTQRIKVGIGQNLIVNFSLRSQTVQLEEITVATAAPETRTSEVATNVTEQQIERLPTPSRNFLDLAALAPGITVSEDRVNGTGFRTFSGGGQSPSSANVFVDGTSLKNDVTAGGVSGQDASRGNPFPRNAIQEYRILSQNFKAEYQKASSALITATTKSGGNVWSGNAFFNFQNQGLLALDTFQLKDKAANSTFTEPDYARYIGGVSLGGPIIKNKLHIFGSYEGNYQNRNNRVAFAPPTGFAALDTVNLSQYNGEFLSPFRETLLFGKLSYAVSPKSSAELSFTNRHETDVRDFGPCCGAGFNSFQEAVNFRQNTTLLQGHYNIFSGPWLNEAKLDYSRFRRNPSPNQSGLPQRLFQVPGADYVIGSNRSTQDFIQKRIGLRDDLTYSGFRAGGQHIFKIGASVDLVKYDILKDNDGTPRFLYNAAYNYQSPFELNYGTGDPALNKKNTQIGMYLQDDWSPTARLTLNLGIRWDFETNMFNTGYVTPQNVVDTLTRYNDSLPTPLDLNRYTTNGSDRKQFYGAFQPRLGFSYALDRENKTTIFGGFGIYYDRSLFDISVDETLKLTHPSYTIRFAAPGVPAGPGEVDWQDSYLTADRAVLDQLVGTFGTPEAWLIDNEAKVPKSRQFNLGVRRQLGTLAVSVTYAGVRSVDQLTMNWANFGLNPNGSCCTSFNTGAHGFSNFIYTTSDAKTWYDALLVQIDRPYRRSSENFGWGAGLAFTYAVRSLQGLDGFGDLGSSFPGAFPNTTNIPKHPANDERARIVANWITDVPYLFGIQFSGLITLGSGNKQDIGGPIRFNPVGYVRGGYSPPGQNFLIFGKWVYRDVSIRLRKDLPSFGRGNLGITADVFNVFNYNNFGCFATPPNQANGDPDPNLGTSTCVVSDARRLQIGAEYDF